MAIHFIGITPDKKCIRKNTLDEIITTPHIDYIFQEITNEHSQGKRWPDYIAVNRDGSNRILSGSNFTIIDISDVTPNSFWGRYVKIFDTSANETYIFTTHKWGYDFLTQELLSLLEKIEEHGGCKRYQDKLRCDALEKENTELKNTILELRQENELLKSKKGKSKKNKE